MICCNDQESEVSGTTIGLKVLNVGEHVISVVRFSMICKLEKFQLNGAAVLDVCSHNLKGNQYVNPGFGGSAFPKAAIGQTNGAFQFN